MPDHPSTDEYNDSAPDSTEAFIEGLIERAERIVAIDFDGVLHSYTSDWQGHEPTDPPTPGARGFVEFLIQQGFSVVIYSARAKQQDGIDGMRRWLTAHGFPELPISTTKPTAVVYIDDRALRFDGDFDLLRTRFEAPELLRPWPKLEPEPHGHWAYTADPLGEYFHPSLCRYASREAAVAAAHVVVPAGQSFWTGRFKEPELFDAAASIAGYLLGGPEVFQSMVQEVMLQATGQNFPGKIELKHHAMLLDDFTAAVLRGLQHLRAERELGFSIVDLERHVAPTEETS